MEGSSADKRLTELLCQQTEKVVGKKDSSLPYVGLEHLATGSPDLIGVAHSDSSVSTNSVFRRGDILFGKLRPNLRKCILAPFPGYCSTDILVLRAEVGADPTYCSKIMQSEPVFAEAIATAVGTKMPRTSWAALRQLKVFCPPLPEQLRIAEILDTVGEAIRKTEQVIAKLQQMKQGLLHDLLTRGIDDNGELRDPDRHPEQFKNSPLGRIPREWEPTFLGSVVDPARPIVYGILMPGRGHSGGVPVVKVKDIVGGHIKREGLLLTSPAIDNEYRRSRLKGGDLLFTIRGTVGRMAFVPSSLEGANITQDTARIGITRADSRFVRQFLGMPRPQRFIETHTIGQAVKGINLRELRQVPLALSDPAEQAAIADVLSAHDRRLDEERSTLDKLTTMKSGLMDDLLTGRVRVQVHEEAAT